MTTYTIMNNEGFVVLVEATSLSEAYGKVREDSKETRNER